MIASLATLALGILIGYMGQRSKFCTISGIRDFFMLKDSFRFKGLLGLIAGSAAGYFAFQFLGGAIPNFPLGMGLGSPSLLIAGVVGSMGLGFFSVFAEGCPFRQHVMAAEGKVSALLYLLGFYLGIVYFNVVTIKWLDLLLRSMG
ncbi:MAG: transporter [Dehalococcoidia bacterium]|nr:MAG: transporter [Dehalococcoidia bacterium]